MQYRLRTLLVITIVASLLASWVASLRSVYRTQHSTLDRIGARWFDFSDKPFPEWKAFFLPAEDEFELVDLLLEGVPSGEEDLSFLVDFPFLEKLTLRDPAFAIKDGDYCSGGWRSPERRAWREEELEKIKAAQAIGCKEVEWVLRFPNLEELSLDHVGWGDEELARITELRELKKLLLIRTRVTPKGLAVLSKLRGLEELVIELDGTGEISGDDLSFVHALPRLRWLTLRGLGITDDDLGFLDGLTGLRFLELRGLRVRGPGLEHLTGLAGLEWVWLESIEPIRHEHWHHITAIDALQGFDLECVDPPAGVCFGRTPDGEWTGRFSGDTLKPENLWGIEEGLELPYWYIVKYQSDVNAALQALRQREFKSGRYNPAVPFPLAPDSPARGAQHASIEEAMEQAGEVGTRSILDLDHVSDSADFHAVAPVPDDVLQNRYGTTQPTREMVEQTDFLEGVEPGQGVYIILYREGRPDEILFAGFSLD